MTQHAEPHHDPRFEDPRTEGDDNWMPPELPGQGPLDQQPDPERADWMPPPEHRPPSLLGEGDDQPPTSLDPTATMPPSGAAPPARPPMPDQSLHQDRDVSPGAGSGIVHGVPGQGGQGPAGRNPAVQGTAPMADPLWPDAEVARFEGRWREVQLGFVDDPRHAADEARSLLDEVVDRLTQAITDRRRELDSWRDGGSNGHTGDDTEAMLGAVRRYRRLMDQLLAVGHPH